MGPFLPFSLLSRVFFFHEVWILQPARMKSSRMFRGSLGNVPCFTYNQRNTIGPWISKNVDNLVSGVIYSSSRVEVEKIPGNEVEMTRPDDQIVSPAHLFCTLNVFQELKNMTVSPGWTLQLLGNLSNNDGDGNENVTSQGNTRCFKHYRAYSI